VTPGPPSDPTVGSKDVRWGGVSPAFAGC
jgi:hypothetical protein